MAVQSLFQRDKNRLIPFGFGVIFGILIMNIGKSILLKETGLYDEDILYRMKYMTVDKDALFCFVLRKRMLMLIIMAVLATTYLGKVVCMTSILWCGLTIGLYGTALALRYSLKGIVLAMVSVFPQAFLYIPVFVLLLGWCERIYQLLYHKAGGKFIDKNSLLSLIMQFLGLGVAIIIGCLLEAYVNTGVLIWYLKEF